MLKFLRQALGSRSDLIIILIMVSILVVLFMPIPAMLLDFLLLTNLSFALLILLLTFHVEKPLAFSTFPSLLLMTTLLRLSLNIAATRLILSHGHAGRVIDAVGSYAVAGNYAIGLVVFIILVVVQYVVVTNGAQRVAEVAARFTLDAMPGKQMSIDADLNMGLIDQDTARKRRESIEKEANFYGAMDGASKFVKGDAIAGVIILLVNIVGGLSVGIIQRGLSWGDALHTYTLLTIGDGIVTQIPALVIATSTGILVTRAATDANLASEISRQVTRSPKSLFFVAIALLIALVLPGIPAVPTLILLAITCGLIYLAMRVASQVPADDLSKDATGEADPDLYRLMAIDPIEVSLGTALVPVLGGDEGGFMLRIKALRKQFAVENGYVIPVVRLRDDPRRPENNYLIRFHGNTVAEGMLVPNHHLAINPNGETAQLEGIPTKDPTFGLPAKWISEDQLQLARSNGYTVVDPVTVLATHFSETIRSQAASLLSRQETERLVNRVRETQPSLVEELLPNVMAMGDVQKILQELLRERVSIRDIELILEVLLDAGRHVKDVTVLTERVRERLGATICQRLVGVDGAMQVLTLHPATERILKDKLHHTDDRQGFVLEPDLLDRLVHHLVRSTEEMLGRNVVPVLLCPATLRRHLRTLTERVLPHLSVVSLTEVPNTATVRSYAVINVA